MVDCPKSRNISSICYYCGGESSVMDVWSYMGYGGTGPYGLFTVMQSIDSNITYKDIIALEQNFWL